MNQELITKAVKVHFACEHPSMKCCQILEDYVGVASDFLNFMLTGNTTPQLEKVLKTKRYQNKLILIKNYIKNETKGNGKN
jgi:hypothetical protein